MKIKMLTSLAGRDYSLSPGEECDFPEGEANRLIAAGYAEAVVAKKEVKRGGKKLETAAKVKGEIRA